MASLVDAILCALVGAAFWSLLGYAAGKHLLPRPLAAGAAPVLGWIIHSALTLPIFILNEYSAAVASFFPHGLPQFAVAFTPASVLVIAGLCVVVSIISVLIPAARADSAPAIPAWCYVAAAALALVPAAAIMPKYSANAVSLAEPIFDHSKIAIIDAMTRQGLPPINPTFGEFGAAGRVAYYYLWHFSAAQLALPLHISGWAADIGLTWFTGFASLGLMMGLAVWLSEKSSAAIVAVLLGAATSLRATFFYLFGTYTLVPFLMPPNGFAGWLYQASWAPQHVMAASCVVLTMVLVARYMHRPSAGLWLLLVLTVTAGFESSTYVGGVTLALAVIVALPILAATVERGRRFRLFVGLPFAAALAIVLVMPFLRDQFAMVAARGGGASIGVHPFGVLGEMFPPILRRVLDLPAYWLVLLPLEFPAICIAGVVGLTAALRSLPRGSERDAMVLMACLAVAGLFISWLLVSKLGDNNDLGLRAVLPAAMVLIVAAAVGVAENMLGTHRALIVITALGGLILSVPGTVEMIGSNFGGTPKPDGAIFAQTPELWQAVRRYAAPSDRVANNPLFLQDLTPWPGNMSWALLADRSSCFSGRELTLAFAPLPRDRREAINAQFVRIFAGQGTAQDISDMAKKYACDVVVVVPQDGAWTNDPFAHSADYHLAENQDGKWRIYVLTKDGASAQ